MFTRLQSPLAPKNHFLSLRYRKNTFIQSIIITKNFAKIQKVFHNHIYRCDLNFFELPVTFIITFQIMEQKRHKDASSIHYESLSNIMGCNYFKMHEIIN